MYSFEMSGKKHSLHLFRGTQEEVSKQLPMMANNKFVEDSKVEVEVKVISQEILSNDFEVEMTNQVCNDWLKKGKDQQRMSNGSMALMEEAQYVVMKENESIICTKGNSRPVAERMLEEMAKGTVQYERTT